MALAKASQKRHCVCPDSVGRIVIRHLPARLEVVPHLELKAVGVAVAVVVWLIVSHGGISAKVGGA
jgi:hypothetical protein